jgi:hypothetical protein
MVFNEFEYHLCHNLALEIPRDLQVGLFSHRRVDWNIPKYVLSVFTLG